MSVLGTIAPRGWRPALSSATLTACVLILAIAVLGEFIAPYDPIATNSALQLMPPSLAHPCGTDQLGRDICSRILVATRIDLFIGVASAALALLFGGAIGAIGGFFGGWFDRVCTWLVDTIIAFPLFLLAMGIVAALGNSFMNVIYATAIVNLPFYARAMRAEILQRRHAGFVEAAQVAGNSQWRILLIHLVPCALPGLAVQASLTMGWAILNAAALSFIGLGIRPPTPEWGLMVADGASLIISGQWWVSIMPGIVLVAVVLSFNLLGDGLRDRLDIRERR
ncbi:ABC transporter permease [Kaistia sp. 32K]|uniref:ABC transporter permease n=1 Tax=Kaistia sp. 32K TaxID=2795690 RepID=UPI001915F8AA|nr:ABC transporter permease [Kaistia sp. 32K]BCP54016.1 ABC transporter permease [Kaistia sp. 32K]